MKYFFIEEAKNLRPMSIVNISGSDARHIKNVLRLAPEDVIGLVDGNGNEYEARITTLSRTGVEVVVTRQSLKKPFPEVQLTIAQALLKDRKMDRLIKQLTELGATNFLPFISHRAVPKPDKRRLILRIQRWDKIVKESLKQCRRGHIMKIKEVVSFENMLSHATDDDLKIAFWEDASEPIPSVVNINNKSEVKRIFAILGPEGGFTSEEMNRVEREGFVIASLGPRILRAETAVIAACALLQYLFGDMG